MEELRLAWANILDVLNFELIVLGTHALTLADILLAAAVVVLTRLVASGLKRFVLKPFYARNSVDVGRSFAISQIATYIVYVIGVAAAFQVIGLEFSVLWAGAAALLVGVGLGLQQTFNDFFSGLLLLIEGPVEVGDVVEVDNFIGRVVEIGLRTTRIRTRDDIMIIVPNSHLVNEDIVNWSHNRSPLRYHVDVGVAYGSDVNLVSRALERAAEEHPDVLERPVPRIMFVDFGESSLDFRLHFYSTESWRIEFIKSDLRFTITRLFRERGIEVPFPQRDVWIRKGGLPPPPPQEASADTTPSSAEGGSAEGGSAEGGSAEGGGS